MEDKPPIFDYAQCAPARLARQLIVTSLIASGIVGVAWLKVWRQAPVIAPAVNVLPDDAIEGVILPTDDPDGR